MPIDSSLLIADSTLQDFLVDKATGLPLTQGVLTFFQDSSRTTLKNIYQITGQPGSYTWTTLPNPLTLSAVGTVVDVNSSDTKIYYYPFSEVDNSTPQQYYVTVDNSQGTRQFVRQDWPPETSGSSPTPGSVIATNKNLISNNVFWRNSGTYTGTSISSTSTALQSTICPSQHDGFSFPDIEYLKDVSGATDTLTFTAFGTANALTGDPTPEFYLNLNLGSGGSETYRMVQIPIALHTLNLSGYNGFTFALQTMNVSGSNNQIIVNLLQYAGTGASPGTTLLLGTIKAGVSWEKSTFSTIFPTVNPAGLGTGGDDAWYIQLLFPTGVAANINIAKPAFYLTNTVPPTIPTNDFETYDQADSIIAAPRTGDVKISMSDFYPFGWVPMSGGTICNSGFTATAPTNLSLARQAQDAWPLFNLLWTKFKPYSVASSELIQIYAANGSTTTFGATAIADWSANKQLSLTKMMGQVILGTVPVPALTKLYSTTFTGSSSGGLLLTTANNVSFFNGMPFYVSNSGGALPTGLSANTIYYVANFSGTTAFNVATSFANAMAGTVVSYTDNGSGTNTLVSAFSGTFEGEYAHTQLQVELATHTHTFTGSAANLINSGNSRPIYTGGGAVATVDLVTLTDTNTGLNPLQVTATGTNVNTGSSTPFNITQPGTFYNIFMKL